jgi:hypothetical protein
MNNRRNKGFEESNSLAEDPWLHFGWQAWEMSLCLAISPKEQPGAQPWVWCSSAAILCLNYTLVLDLQEKKLLIALGERRDPRTEGGKSWALGDDTCGINA